MALGDGATVRRQLEPEYRVSKQHECGIVHIAHMLAVHSTTMHCCFFICCK